ncbi:hypothetical protein SAY87_029156 [Trapa incisa]|uniref:SLC26A/SulP transporter domain-containing protein n=1 Tax=Trapa incisa TaxID=236973 RepID=A0AAN7QPX8_9MYRT|nr:hypothetical protein SAY87_029156 [Trapa incisa]
MSLFYYTPNVILAAIIITAVIGLIDYQAAYQSWKVDKLDFLACLSSFFGVDPYISYSWNTATISGWSISVQDPLACHKTKHSYSWEYSGNSHILPSFLTLAIEASIYFANSTYLQERSISDSNSYCKIGPSAITVVLRVSRAVIVSATLPKGD